MSNQTTETSTGDDLLKNSTLYKEFQAEREEILRHKWIESEKAGYDIGFERALTDWIIKHRSKWRKGRQSGGHGGSSGSHQSAVSAHHGQGTVQE